MFLRVTRLATRIVKWNILKNLIDSFFGSSRQISIVPFAALCNITYLVVSFE